MIVNARYANAPAKRKGQDLSNVECYTCHKKGHYSNKLTSVQKGSPEGLLALVRMTSLGAHTTKRIRTGVRNAGRRSHGRVGPKAAMGYFAYFRLFLCRVLALEVLKH
jgi:hypothetical protein